MSQRHVRGSVAFLALMALGVVLLVSDALDTEQHRTFNLVIAAVMFCLAALDLALWIRRQPCRGQRRTEAQEP